MGTAAKTTTGWFRYTTRKDCLYLIVGITLATVASCLNLLETKINGDLLNHLIGYNYTTETSPFKLLWFAGENFLLSILEAIILSIGVICIVTFFDRQIKAYQKNYFHTVLHKNVAYYDHRPPNAIAAILNGIDLTMSEKLGRIIGILAYFVGVEVCIFIQNWQMGLLSNCILMVIIIETVIYKVATSSTNRRYSKYNSTIKNLVADVLSGIYTVITCNGQSFETEKYDKLVDKQQSTKQTLKFANALYFSGVCSAIDMGTYVLHFVVITLMFNSNGEFEYGTNISYARAIVSSFWGVWQIVPEVLIVMQKYETVKKLLAGINEAEKATDGDKSILGNVEGNITFANVDYAYSSTSNQPILKNINLNITAGEKIAFVGTSGSGKSTVAALLAKLRQPKNGKILIDNVGIETLETAWLRQIIGFIPQEPVMFPTTVRDNICLGTSVSNEKLNTVCQTAYALDFIKRLPQGFDTIIGSGGVRLSGGQKQRIAIARALIQDPKILVLDEATSALDTRSESIVQAALEAAYKDRTIISIAHRLTTIRNVDKIVVFDNGKIIEEGTHVDLVAANKLYTELLTAQQQELDLEECINIVEPKTVKYGDESNSFIGPSTTIQSQTLSWKNIITYSKASIWLLLIGFIIAFINGTCFILMMMLEGKFREISLLDAETGIPLSRKWYAISWSLVAGDLSIITVATCLLMKYGMTIATKLQKQAYTNVLTQDGYFFDKQHNTIGNLVRIITEEPNNLEQGFDASLCLFFIFIGGFIGQVFYCATFHVKLTIGATATIIIYGLGVFKLYFYLQKYDKEMEPSNAKAATIATESIQHIETVKIHCAEKYMFDLYLSTIKNVENIRNKQIVFQGIMFSVGQTFSHFLTPIILILGIIVIYFHGIGQPMDILYMSQLPSIIMLQAILLLPDLDRCINAFGQLYRVATDEAVIKNAEDANTSITTTFDKTVALENVTFAYPSNPERNILANLTLSIEKGKKTALVGASGCGKSTVVQLLSRMYDPVDGQVKIDSNGYAKLNLKTVRTAFAFVGQDPALFDLSIRENIAYGCPQATMAEIEGAARTANIHDFIASLPSGYETRLGSRGTHLSGGQRQRLAIARALVRNPAVIVLDEATSALDAKSEAAFQKAMETAMDGKTCLIIAHRLSTVRDADKIAVLQNGQIEESGTHLELIQRDGVYRRLVTGQ